MLLLHGMGATGAVWRRVVDVLRTRWSGRLVVCDLPGHGASSPLEDYSPPVVAAAVARAVPAHGPVMIVGHSFGGYLAILLASDPDGLDVSAVVATGVKVGWTSDELDRAAAFASRPPSWFDSFAEAEARYRKAAGLTEDVTRDIEDLARGVVEVEGRFRLSHDPRSAAVSAPDMATAVEATLAPTLLSRGEADRMVSRDELLTFSPDAVDIPGGGHNIHVQHPQAFAEHVLAFEMRAAAASGARPTAFRPTGSPDRSRGLAGSHDP
jgi:pimeloyl-ACP methyl ester carboxylesterase